LPTTTTNRNGRLSSRNIVNQAVIGAASLQNSLSREDRDRSIPIDRFDRDEFPDVYDCLPELLSVLRSDMLQTNINWLVSALQLELADNPSREKK